jgi:hypothetical protein
MRAISTLFPEEFKYHANWKTSECDVAYWRDSTSIDHIVPATRNGTNDVANLVTSCWPCNLSKGNLLLSELGQDCLPTAIDPWDGLTSHLEALIARMESPSSYFINWLSAITRPEKL